MHAEKSHPLMAAAGGVRWAVLPMSVCHGCTWSKTFSPVGLTESARPAVPPFRRIMERSGRLSAEGGRDGEAGKPQASASADFERYDPRWRVVGKTGRRGGYLLPMPPGRLELTGEEREAAARAAARAGTRLPHYINR
jgi:hypothetical protein